KASRLPVEAAQPGACSRNLGLFAGVVAVVHLDPLHEFDVSATERVPRVPAARGRVIEVQGTGGPHGQARREVTSDDAPLVRGGIHADLEAFFLEVVDGAGDDA